MYNPQPFFTQPLNCPITIDNTVMWDSRPLGQSLYFVHSDFELNMRYMLNRSLTNDLICQYLHAGKFN
jgi:hypothetical protein